MFKFLKKKLSDAVGVFKKGVEEKGEEVEAPKVEKPKKEKRVVEKPKKKEVKKKEVVKEELKEEVKEVKEEPKEEEEKVEEEKPVVKEEPKEKKGFFGKIKEKVTTKKINENQFDELFWELEVALLENNVAFEVIEKIKEDLKVELVNTPLQRRKIETIILDTLKKSVDEVLEYEDFDLVTESKKKKPYVIVFIGVNGSGKTTSISKIGHLLQEKGMSIVLAAADTFRAASIQQLEEQGKKLGAKVIKHDYGSDPAAVGFDAVKYAKQKDIDVVLIDTAGRQHSNINLRDEMKKIIRVVNPDLKLYIGEMISGNDCIEQIKEFDKAIDIDGVILSKADVDEKGGTAISVSYVTGKPILFIGVGQELQDLEKFSKDKILKNLGF
ncbi:signal recognition particle-docking protein FtsY [archaeon]|jgi:fused signal recognition particle receptor|nr:signal recognition particle-docking protein FtsY [archaeon]MBT4396982.1 signal recognition particle-docking protein FtsY [archaeon]MBT4440973.1 signal recognition particle-docking protein FtsY [archaeon]